MSSTGAPAGETRRVLTASDGVELAYWISRQEEGADRVVLLVHGLGSNHTRWSEFVERTSLTESWDVLQPDLRGNGESLTRKTRSRSRGAAN